MSEHKPPYKNDIALVIGLIICATLFVFIILGNISSQNSNSLSVDESSSSITETNSSTEVDFLDTSSSSETSDEELDSDTTDAIVDILDTTFDKVADVGFDDENEVITLTPKDPNFTAAALDASTSEDWEEMTDSLDELSQTIHKNFKVSIPLVIINPHNTDKILYETLDGVPVYDVKNTTE